ncbi:hypothetical protein [Paraburkholderia sp. GAS334]|uniref:hypothetical protein n=1 Tax=Paraburkholderia sp. GAS334 TaxID=3035131 RepID=UPI003D19BBB5
MWLSYLSGKIKMEKNWRKKRREFFIGQSEVKEGWTTCSRHDHRQLEDTSILPVLWAKINISGNNY